ncbi:MAG: DUF2442 domain-containing protein [Candidatus Symbiodolus clandestinus]
MKDAYEAIFRFGKCLEKNSCSVTNIITLAEAQGLETLNSPNRAIAARYDFKAQRVMMTLVSGIELAIPPAIVQGLNTATPDELADIELTPMGIGFYFPTIDADVFVLAILQDFTGTRQWMARKLGR